MEQDINKNIKNLEKVIELAKRTGLDKTLANAIEHLIKAYKELEEENERLETENQEFMYKYGKVLEENEELTENYNLLEKAYITDNIPKSVVEEKLKKEKLLNIIVGGRRNATALKYGKKLGRIEMCEELLEKRK